MEADPPVSLEKQGKLTETSQNARPNGDNGFNGCSPKLDTLEHERGVATWSHLF